MNEENHVAEEQLHKTHNKPIFVQGNGTMNTIKYEIGSSIVKKQFF